jgi:hypothetical protein
VYASIHGCSRGSTRTRRFWSPTSSPR